MRETSKLAAAGAGERAGPWAGRVERVQARIVSAEGRVSGWMSWERAAREIPFEGCPPVRVFPVRRGRRVAPGWWWAATTGRLVHYGFGAMRTQVMMLDHDPAVVALACRPVELAWFDQRGEAVVHAPHLMARLADGSGLLVDCAGRTGTSARLADCTGPMTALAGAVGWRYCLAVPPDEVLAANVRWLAGYRHPRNRGRAGVAAAVREAFARPVPLIEGVRAVGDPIEVLPLVFHALWHGHLTAPLEMPLHEQTIVGPGTVPGNGDGV